MKAAQISEYGGEEALKVTEIPKPTIEANQVLVQVHAAATNPFDWKVRDGIYKEYIPLTLPATLGGDLAGTVSEIGADVTGFAVGQEVYGMAGATSGKGSYAEFAPVKATQLAPKPANVDFDTAAALPLAGISAYQALIDHMNLKSGQRILIHGGAGGIGALAIQIAKQIGAVVATTVAAEDTEYVKDLGASEVVDYKSQDFSELLSDYDAVFDTVGGETNTKSYGVLKSGGTLVSMVMPEDTELAKRHDVQYVQQSSMATVERLTKLAELVDSGTVKVNIDKTFTLEEASKALEYLKTGHPRGKVVIRVLN